MFTIKLLKIPTPKNIAVIILKLVSFYYRVMCPKDVHGIANSVDTDQTDLHCLPGAVCPKTYTNFYF